MFVLESFKCFAAVVPTLKRVVVLFETRYDPVSVLTDEFHLKVPTVTRATDQIDFPRWVHRCMQGGFHDENGTVDRSIPARLLNTPSQLSDLD